LAGFWPFLQSLQRRLKTIKTSHKAAPLLKALKEFRGDWVMSTKKMTVCSTMHCYNEAEETNDPAKPPFCEECKAKTKKDK